jgi:Polysaccharide pyruvyl transferase
MKVLVTGIKSYVAFLAPEWGDQSGRHFDVFPRVRSRKELMDATRFNGNTGNFFIGEGALNAVGREKSVWVDFGYLHAKTANADYLESVNKSFSCVVFVTANLLRSDYDASFEADLLSRFSLPIVILGIGSQRVNDLPGKLPAGTRRLIEVLKSKEHHIFTRGKPTADYLTAQGLKNIWPTGCPSLFLRPDQTLTAMRRMKEVDWRASMRMMFSGYLGKDAASVSDIQLFSLRQPASSYVLQDEHLFHGFNFMAEDDDVIYNDMAGEIERSSQFLGLDKLRDLRMRIFFNTHQWRAVMAEHDVCFGKRFHGVVAGLQVGTPGLMIAIDDRMREMLRQFNIPFIDEAEWNAAEDKFSLIEETNKRFDLASFEDSYQQAIVDFRTRTGALGLG